MRRSARWSQWHPDLREVVRLAFPAIGNSLLQTLVFLVDRLMLGHHSEDALAAMQTAGPIVWTVYSVFGAFSVGTIAVVGRAVGAGDHQAAKDAARASLGLALVVGIVVGLVTQASLGPLVSLLGTGNDPAVRAVAMSYLRIVLPAMPAFFVGLACISVLQASGNTRTPLLIGLATNALNIVGNSILVFGNLGAPRLGAAGSAWSSVAAAVLEAMMGLWVITRPDTAVRLSRGTVSRDWAAARRVLAVASGSWGEKVVYHAAFLAFVRFVIVLGPATMAANQALISLESISFLTADGCAIAAGALVAQRLGSKEPDRARMAGWLAAGLCASLLAVSGLVFALVPGVLVSAFRNDPAIVAIGARALRVGALAQVPMAIAVVLAQAIRGAGATREALVVSFVGAALVRLVATYAFVDVFALGLVGVWLGSTSDWVVRAIVYGWRWRTGSWAKTAV